MVGVPGGCYALGMVLPRPGLGPYLDRLASEYGPGHLKSDPLVEVRRFSDPADREVAGFLAAGLAFGRVDLILRHLRELWDRIDHAPARTAVRWHTGDAERLAGFTHRWVRGADLAVMIPAIGGVRRRRGSLGALFLDGYRPEEPTLVPALSRFVRELETECRSVLGVDERVPLPRGVATFLADPARGGACKRLHLFLRWMIRPDDGVDLGLWRDIPPDRLLVPLDTHVARLSRHLGLTARRTVDGRMAHEVTAHLRRFDPTDPVRYDFALARLGILDRCPRRVRPDRCRECLLMPVCTLGGDPDGRS